MEAMKAVFKPEEKVIAAQSLDDDCPGCKRKGSLQLVVLQDYASLLFIPFVAGGKSGDIRCGNCTYKITQNIFPEAYYKQYQELKKTAKTPLWTYSGVFALVLFPFLCLAVSFFIPKDEPKKDQLLEQLHHPVKNDRYKVKVDEDRYSWIMVDSVSQDSVWLRKNTISTPIRAGLSAISEKPYDTTRIVIHRSDLDSMYRDKQIFGYSK